MIRNHNGYWMSPKFLYAPDDGGGAGGAENGAGGEANPAGDDRGNDGSGGENGAGNKAEELNAEIEKMKAEMARQKEALDKANREAGEYRKQLRAKQTQEEIDAAQKKEAEEKAAQELEDLRKEVARARNAKSVMSKLGTDEDTAGKIAECLNGCENIEAALLEIQKVWTAREKSLRIEFGKIPGPGAGGSSEEDSEERAAIERAKNLGRERAASNKSVVDGLQGYLR